MGYSLGTEIITNLELEKNMDNKMLFSKDVIDALGDDLEIKPGNIRIDKGFISNRLYDENGKESNTISDEIEKDIDNDYLIRFNRSYNKGCHTESQYLSIIPKSNASIMEGSIIVKMVERPKNIENWNTYEMGLLVNDAHDGMYLITKKNYNNNNSNIDGNINYYDGESVRIAQKYIEKVPGTVTDELFKKLSIHPSASTTLPDINTPMDMMRLVNGILKNGADYCASLIENNKKRKSI